MSKNKWRKWNEWDFHKQEPRVHRQIGWILGDTKGSLGFHALIKHRKNEAPMYMMANTVWTPFPEGIETEEEMKKYVEVLARMS